MVIVIIIIIIAIPKGPNFHKLFSDYAGESWCTIAKDDSYISIDTNPTDIDDYYNSDAYSAIMEINKILGFSDALSDALNEKIGNTNSLAGRMTEENKKIKVSWTYHPDNGLEIIYEKK